MIILVALLLNLSRLSTSLLYSRDHNWTQFQLWPNKHWADSDNDLFISAGDALTVATQLLALFFCHSSTLFNPIEMVVHQDIEVPFHTAEPQLSSVERIDTSLCCTPTNTQDKNIYEENAKRMANLLTLLPNLLLTLVFKYDPFFCKVKNWCYSTSVNCFH